MKLSEVNRELLKWCWWCVLILGIALSQIWEFLLIPWIVSLVAIIWILVKAKPTNASETSHSSSLKNVLFDGFLVIGLTAINLLWILVAIFIIGGIIGVLVFGWKQL